MKTDGRCDRGHFIDQLSAAGAVTLQCNLKNLRCFRILRAPLCTVSMFLSPPDKYLSSLGPEFIYFCILGASNLWPSVQTMGNPTGQVGD